MQRHGFLITYVHYGFKAWYFIDQLYSISGVLKKNTFNQKFNLSCNFLEAYSIVSAIPKSWKNAIKDYGDRLEIVKSLKIEELLKSKQKTTKVAYNAILQSVASEPTKAQTRWCDELSIPDIEWKTYYRIPFCCTVQTKLQSCCTVQTKLQSWHCGNVPRTFDGMFEYASNIHNYNTRYA